MLDIGWTEILVIGMVAIVVFPSKDLPKLLRTTGQMVGRVRRMAGDFQSQFNAALREAEREVDLDDTRRKVEGLKSANPLADVKKALNPLRTAGDEIRKTLTEPAPKVPSNSQFVPPPVKPAVDAPASAATPARPASVDVPAPAVAPSVPPKIEAPAVASDTPARPKKPREPAKPKPVASERPAAAAKAPRTRKAATAGDAPAAPPRSRKKAGTPEGGSS